MRRILLLPLSLLACLATGCPEQWYVSPSSEDLDDGRLAFCVSRLPGCHGGAPSLNDVVIEEMGSAGTSGRPVWILHRQEASGLSRIVYGIVPAGLREERPAEPLKENVFYGITGEYYFRFSTLAGRTHVEILSRSDFMHDFR